ncbi:MAG: hypothetical protein O3B95_10115 [Chloroflexi bacterium]|nr:hypothetical protein [Chloroflexota bacterium]
MRQQSFLSQTDPLGRQRGAVAIEVAIISIAGLIAAIFGTIAMLGTSFLITDDGEATVNYGFAGSASKLIVRSGLVAESGEIDVDGDDTILLSGVDELAVAKLKFVVEPVADIIIDLTPPNIVDDTLTDPDSSGFSTAARISVSWDEFTTNSAEWSVVFLGDSNGDYFLEHGERAELTIWLHQYDGTNVLYDLGSGSADGFVDTSTELLQERDTFTIELVVGGSSSLALHRTLPLELGISDLLD